MIVDYDPESSAYVPKGAGWDRLLWYVNNNGNRIVRFDQDRLLLVKTALKMATSRFLVENQHFFLFIYIKILRFLVVVLMVKS